MRPIKTIRILFTTIIIFLWFKMSAAGELPRPNIVLIFCDDLGYGDPACYGSNVHRTPHIDRLAQEGVRFTDFYVSACVCSPSRASLLTGCYPKRIDMHVNEKPSDTFRAVLQPKSPKGLNPDEVTIADILKKQGYATACIGKWHLGDQPEFFPKHYGFDIFYGIPYSHNMNTESCPLRLITNDAVLGPVDVPHLTRRMTQKAVGFIRENKDNPFFLYLPHPMPHFPLDASAPFKGQSQDGIYGDAVEEIDWSVGEICETLEKYGLSDNTLVVFTSDNGGEGRSGPNKGGLNTPLRGHKGTTWEGGMRVPCIVRWPEAVPSNVVCRQLVTVMDFLPTFTAISSGKMPDVQIDGKDISPLLYNPENTDSPHDYFLYYEKDQLQAVRLGKWKLHLALQEKYPVAWKNQTIAFPKPHLYDLSQDISETHNLADKYPEIVEKIQKIAEKARITLGDRNVAGSETRSAAYVDDPVCVGSIH